MIWPKHPPLAFSVAETSVAEMSGPKRPRPKCPWPKCPTFVYSCDTFLNEGDILHRPSAMHADFKTHSSLNIIFYETSTNSVEPDHVLQNVGSDQVLPFLHTECTFKI